MYGAIQKKWHVFVDHGVYNYKKFCVHFTHSRRSPLWWICMKFCLTVSPADIINRAKFCLDRVRVFKSVGSNFGFSIRKRNRR